MTKLRLTQLLLVFAFLVAPRPSPSAPLAPQAPALCAASSSAAALPSFIPAIFKSLPPLPKCGACSQTICLGATVGSACGIAGGQHCVDFAICPADGLTQCVCKTGPIY